MFEPRLLEAYSVVCGDQCLKASARKVLEGCSYANRTRKRPMRCFSARNPAWPRRRRAIKGQGARARQVRVPDALTTAKLRRTIRCGWDRVRNQFRSLDCNEAGRAPLLGALLLMRPPATATNAVWRPTDTLHVEVGSCKLTYQEGLRAKALFLCLLNAGDYDWTAEA